ncbi:hypothetical protein EBZ39_02755 [bacterium]|nr:hypothetical protein [bacterium]
MQKKEFVYPGSDFDRAKNLIALLGSFWSEFYAGADQLTTYVNAVSDTAAQSYRNLLETIAALSRYDVPLFHKETWAPVVLKKSQLNSAQTNIAKFDRTRLAFNGAQPFDMPQSAAGLFAFPLPDNLVNFKHLYNQLAFPTVALAKNFDFIIDIDNNAIVFNRNPFDNSGLLKRISADTAADEEITLWAFCAEYDYNYVFEQFAYAVGIKLQTSQGYKDLVNAVIDGLLAGGLTSKTLDAAFSAICGIPVSAAPQETVDVVRYDGRGLFIATDKNVYRFKYAAEPIVTPGMVLSAGSQLVRGFSIIEFSAQSSHNSATDEQNLICTLQPDTFLSANDNNLLLSENADNLIIAAAGPDCRSVNNEISALALGSGFLSACFYGDLIFENREVPLEVDVAHPSGFTYVKFGIGGLPADVTHFFDMLHARGIEYATNPPPPCTPHKRLGTLAQMLDWRKNLTSEPGPEHLPKTINPMKFIVENVLRNNVFVVRIFVPALGQNHLGLYNIRHLQQLIPPQTALIVIFEFVAEPDVINSADSIIETTGFFKGAEPQADNVTDEYVADLGATPRLISLTCQ